MTVVLPIQTDRQQTSSSSLKAPFTLRHSVRVQFYRLPVELRTKVIKIKIRTEYQSTEGAKAAKVQAYETMVLNILCYNSETWIRTAEINRQLRVFEMGCLRRVMDVTRRDHIKNVDIRANLGITDDIVERIQARRLRYFGHVVRMDRPTPSAKHCVYGRVEGKRVKGRPRKRWLDNVTDDCYHRGWSIVEATHLATDRQRRRTYSVPRHRHDNNKKRLSIRRSLAVLLSPVYCPLHKHQYRPTLMS